VSEKGSAGKTSQALSLTLFYIGKSFNTLLIDFNRNNPDLEDVFANFLAKVKIIEKDGQPGYIKKELPVAGRMGGRTFTFIKPISIPQSPREMWMFFADILKSEPTATKIIVDTGENLHNFIVKQYNEKDKWITITPLFTITPVFWYTWMWAAPGSRNKMKRIEDSVRYMKEFFNDWNDNNLVNVFNVYRVNDKIKKLNRIVREVRMRYKRPGIDVKPLSFDRIMKCVNIVAKSLGINDPLRDEIKIREIPGLWADTFENMLGVLGQESVFSNICILESVPKVTMFIDQVIMSRPTKIAQIRRLLGRFYDNFIDFAKMYEISKIKTGYIPLSKDKEFQETIREMSEEIKEDKEKSEDNSGTKFTESGEIEVDTKSHT